MNFLIDDVVRILATPMPRRKAFRLIGGLLAAAFMTTIGEQRASAVSCGATLACPTGFVCCKPQGNVNNGICCAHGTCCCGGGGEGNCQASSGGTCPSGQGCSPV